MNLKPTVIARRWDGVGGRLRAILNAWSIAHTLGLDFRFIWPRGISIGLDEPAELFSRDFLDKFEISNSACADRTWIRFSPSDVNAHEFHNQFDAAPSGALIDIEDCFRILVFKDESPEAARQRFLRDFLSIQWSLEIVALINDINNYREGQKYCAIHIRAGDIVFGDWRQFLPNSKYLPTTYVESIINSFASVGNILIVSDNMDYVNVLKARFNFVHTPEDIVRNYHALSDAQKMFADILLLASSQRMFGPHMSAFSQLAADLGSSQVCGIDEVINGIDVEQRLISGVANKSSKIHYTKKLSPLIARDICWCLDVFSDNISLAQKVFLAARAVRLDSKYCGALNRWALALAMFGRRSAAKKAVARALSIAAATKTHQDPLVEALANAVAVKTIAIAGYRSAWRGVWEYIFPSFSKSRIIQEHKQLETMKQDMARCEMLAPYQTEIADVLINIRYLIAASEWFIKSDARYREIIRACVFATEADDVVMSSWRVSGKETLVKSDDFPQVLRNIEYVSIRIARAIGVAISSTPRPSPPDVSHIDIVKKSSSGLLWLTGSARDARQSGNGLAIGLEFDGKVVSGGAIFLQRSGVGEAVNLSLDNLSDFTFPIPLNNGQSEGAGRPSPLRCYRVA